MRLAGLVVLAALAVSCKPMAGTADAGPPEEIVLTTKAGMPVSKATFEKGDEVFCLRDDGRLELEARVEEVATEPPPGAPPSLAKGEAAYKVYIGSGRFAKSEWLAASRVFPPPWVTTVKIGDTVYERRSGDFKRPKCVVAEVPATKRDAVRATCEGEGRTRLLNRKDSIAVFRTPAPGELEPGDVVYFKKWSWVMVVGRQDDRVVVREAGSGGADRAVLLSTLEAVH